MRMDSGGGKDDELPCVMRHKSEGDYLIRLVKNSVEFILPSLWPSVWGKCIAIVHKGLIPNLYIPLKL